MTSWAKQDPAEDIKGLLTDINRSWLPGRVEQLEKYFQSDMVIAAPGLKVVVRGRYACVQSYQDFVDRATILDYQDCDFSVDVWGSTAVASYRFHIVYEMKGHRHRDAGHDLFVFMQQQGQWQAVWRTLIVDGGNSQTARGKMYEGLRKNGRQ